MVRLILLSLFAGFLYAAGFPLLGTKYYFFPGPILGFYIFGKLLKDNTCLKKQILAWTFFSQGFYILGFNWIPYTLYEFGNVEEPFNQVIGFFSFIVLLPPVIIFILALHLSKKYLPKDINNYLKDPISLSIIATLFLENIPVQFPAFPGHSWLFFTPYLGLGTIFGASIFNFFSLFISIQLVLKKIDTQLLKNIGYQAFFFIGINLAISFIQNQQPQIQEKINIRIVQANIGNDSKTASENGDLKSIYQIFSTYYDLSLKKSLKQIDLIIWPETAFPYNINTKLLKRSIYNIPHLIEEILRKSKSNLFLGVRDAPSEKKLYNSGMFLDKDFNFDIYYKNKLLPFGEDLPLGPLTQIVKPYFPSIAFFDKGDKTTIFKLKNNIHFSSMICYEVLFPKLIYNQIRDVKKVPHFFVNITNDSWYGNTSEPEQHLFLSRWRAIEFGIPLVRSTNTGISTIINPKGDYKSRIEYNVEGVLDQDIYINKNSGTLFSITGNYLFNLISLLIIILRFLFRTRKALF
jgi:apolipoprotein N-acyltransferase